VQTERDAMAAAGIPKFSPGVVGSSSTPLQTGRFVQPMLM